MKTFEPQTLHSHGRLLVVDDDLVQRSIIGKIGAKLGYEAVMASSYEIAAELLRTEKFNIMTLDLSLGERDGVELLRLVADLKLNAMPIVVISGCEERVLNNTRRIGQALDLSLTCCLSKPLQLDNVRDALMAPVQDQTAVVGETGMATVDRERVMAGLSGNEFLVEFRPKVDLKSGQTVGAEAMARWRTSEFGIVAPAIFLPLVARFGLMPELTTRIVSSALADSRKLIDQYPGFTVAVDLSGSLLTDQMLPERIERILHEQGVAPESLTVEVSESVVMSDVNRATDILSRLKSRRIRSAIKDFGAGFSSLAALARLPFSELKIDQSFIRGCDADEEMMKIVEAAIGLARVFGMKVAAEGVDNPPTLARLRQAGCDLGQGSLFAPSLRFERIENWMTQREAQNTGPLFEQPRSIAPQPAW